MIQSQLFRRHFALIVLVLSAFVLLGFFANILMVRMTREPRPLALPALLSRTLDRIPPADRFQALSELEEVSELLHIQLVNEAGYVIFPEGEALAFRWEDFPKPDSPNEPLRIKGSEGKFRRGTLSLLGGEPRQYLFIVPKRGRDSRRANLVYSAAILFASVLMGVGLSLFLLYRSLGKKAVLADHVISELQQGNLKARFPVTKMDEIGQAMSRFNRMADEIERLVERLRSTERARVSLLQELAHDLRTPIASLKSLVESLGSRRDTLSREVQEEMIALAGKEIDYFARLVEDLLFLARISEPRYSVAQQEVNLALLLEEEAEAARVVSSGKKVSVTGTELGVIVQGDEHLLRRLIRNGLDNAVSFAHESISLSVQLEGRDAVLRICNDGNGFSEEALKNFGERKASRMMNQEQGGRLSLGLGSVIMGTIARIHGGGLEAKNTPKGAEVIVRLPLKVTTSGIDRI